MDLRLVLSLHCEILFTSELPYCSQVIGLFHVHVQQFKSVQDFFFRDTTQESAHNLMGKKGIVVITYT